MAARAILGEWLGGSGGGWQDSGGVWPGIKLIHGVTAGEGDPEFGISRGRLLPSHKIFEHGRCAGGRRANAAAQPGAGARRNGAGCGADSRDGDGEVPAAVGDGVDGAASRRSAILDEVLGHLRERRRARRSGPARRRNFDGPIQTIIPWAGNLYTSTLIERARAEFGDDFWGFWMLGGMSGGGMGFLFRPGAQGGGAGAAAGDHERDQAEMEHCVPFAMEPVVYDFAINERGTQAELLTGDCGIDAGGVLHAGGAAAAAHRGAQCYRPGGARSWSGSRRPAAARTSSPAWCSNLFDHLLPRGQEQDGGRAQSLDSLLEDYGFDRVQHEQIQGELRSGQDRAGAESAAGSEPD